MGSHSSKAAKGDVMAQDAAGDASPSKSNGQENGHVKVNGDLSPKADGEVSSLNDSGSAEAPKEPAKAETGGGDAIEPAPVAEGEAKPDGAASTNASKQTPKKKKRFSFKKSFKLSGISFRKAKKETGDASATSSPTEEQQGKAEAAEAEDQSATAATEEGEQANAPQEETAAPVEAAAAAPAAKRQDGSEEPAKEEEQPQQPPSSESQGDVKPDESSESAEVEPSAAAGTAAAADTAVAAAAAEQKEE
ncbi:MARCKS-related protein [Protobothrops mucrosquamatus]|uniref:MARCKS-related protein n=1 Tax=Protobothrops mucrosquamatus TaxID=103944 RepID=UPI000775CEEA|nr:MARCKS-related protein [Protobothrops mucrosquamatus]